MQRFFILPERAGQRRHTLFQSQFLVEEVLLQFPFITLALFPLMRERLSEVLRQLRLDSQILFQLPHC